MKTFYFPVFLSTIFLDLNLSQLFPPVFIPSRRVGSWMTASFHLDEDACSSVINILLTFDLVCRSVEAQQTESGVEWQLCTNPLLLSLDL